MKQLVIQLLVFRAGKLVDQSTMWCGPNVFQSHLDNAWPLPAGPVLNTSTHAEQTPPIGHWHITPSPSCERIGIGMISPVGSAPGTAKRRSYARFVRAYTYHYHPSINQSMERPVHEDRERATQREEKLARSRRALLLRTTESDPPPAPRAQEQSFPRPEQITCAPARLQEKSHVKACISGCAVLA
jgi:hypothetical protein